LEYSEGNIHLSVGQLLPDARFLILMVLSASDHVCSIASRNARPEPSYSATYFFQNDGKVTPRLSVNLGLRWDKDINTLGITDVHKSSTYPTIVPSELLGLSR
jgi:outer membrane receptor protein involved in Fe transport